MTKPDAEIAASSAMGKYWCRLTAFVLIVGAMALRIWYLSSRYALDLAPDEAHYWDWARHLDWSYYSKGPLIAWLIHVSWSVFQPVLGAIGNPDVLAVRLPAVLCGGLLITSMYVLTLQVFRKDSLALAVTALALTVPVLNAGAMLMTIDAPYTCLWGWTLVFCYHALFHEKTWAWVAAGMLVALGIMAKYTMVLVVPSLVFFMLFTPGFRGVLLRPGFIAFCLIGVLGAVPILIWNYQNDWVTFQHMRGHAGLNERRFEFWQGPLKYVGTQAGLLLGYWFIVWAAAMWSCRPWKETRTDLRYLWWMSATVFLVFFAFTIKNGGGEPNWPITAYLSGGVLAAGWLAHQFYHANRAHRLATRGWLFLFAVLGLGVSLLSHQTSLAYGELAQLMPPASPQNPMPMRRLDPTCRLQGWRMLGKHVDIVREQLRAQGVEPELAGTSWTLPGEMGFYCAGHPTVYSLGAFTGDRHSQYDLWRPNPVDDPEKFHGKTFIIVGSISESLRHSFESIEHLVPVNYSVRGHLINRWYISIARGYRGSSYVPKRRF